MKLFILSEKDINYGTLPLSSLSICNERKNLNNCPDYLTANLRSGPCIPVYELDVVVDWDSVPGLEELILLELNCSYFVQCDRSNLQVSLLCLFHCTLYLSFEYRHLFLLLRVC